MIDRIVFYVYSNDLFNDNQYGFTPQRGKIDAAVKVKNFIEDSLRLKQCTIIVSLTLNGHLMQPGGPAFPRIYTIYQHVTLAIGKQHYQ
jgi:hypothetical protein